MKATILVSGPQGCGKTTWLDQVKAALLATVPAETVEVRLCEGLFQYSYRVGEELHDEFTIPGAESSEGTTAASGDRETWSVQPWRDDHWAVFKGTYRVAIFVAEPDANIFMRYMAAPFGRRRAVDAILKGSSFVFDGDYPYFTGGRIENRNGGGGEIAEGAGVISAAEAPAIHGLLSLDPLREAALSLYNAGAWQLYGATMLSPSAQERMWTRLRDALDLPPGTATAAGTAPKKCPEAFFECLPSSPTEETDEEGAYDFAIDQLSRAWDMLETAADVFEQYADHHHAKNTPESLLKARRNDRLARMCRNTIRPAGCDQDVAEAA